jgi:hypothetical protein
VRLASRSLVVAIVAFAFPAVARADVNYSVTPSPSGAPVSVSTGSTHQNVNVTFGGTAGDRVLVDQSNWNSSCGAFTLYNPDNSSDWYSYNCGPKASGAINENQTGTYTYTFAPDDTGSLTLTFYQVPPDSQYSASPTPSGDVLTTSTTTPGQAILVTFTGWVGEKLYVDQGDWGTGCGQFYLYNPDGSQSWTSYNCGPKGSGVLDLWQSGTYTYKFVPDGDSTVGSLGLTFFRVPPTIEYSAFPTQDGTSVPIETLTPGQAARIAFWGTAGDSIDVNQSLWETGCGTVAVQAPDSGQLWAAYQCGPKDSGPVTLSETGTYTVTYTPADDGVGNLTMVLTEAGADLGALAYKFMPVLDFDSTEKWRPLNVDLFLTETNPSTGQPWNGICDGNGNCQDLTGPEDLANFDSTSDYIQPQSGGLSLPDSYVSPNPACAQTNEYGTTLHDCDTGPASAIYYHVAGPSPGGYDYIDYWAFYRYNQGYEDEGNHAGDWEGITVAPTPDGNAIAYVELSQHGEWQSYLPSGLTCQSECSTADNEVPGGTNIDVFPAAGSHANYAQADDSPPGDNSNDGEEPWGNNLNPNALLPFPTPAGQGNAWTSGPENWTDWPGAWGDTPEQGALTVDGSPCGPAAASGSAANGSCGDDHSGHYYAPWSEVGTNLLCSGADCPQLRRRAFARQAEPRACSTWFGGDVVAALCAQAPLRHALTHHELGGRGSFTMILAHPRRKAATAPGLAQLLGRPLRPGGRVAITGALPPGTRLFVHAMWGRVLATVSFDVGRIRGRAVVEAERGLRGRPRVILKIGRRWLAPATIEAHTLHSRQAVPPVRTSAHRHSGQTRKR